MLLEVLMQYSWIFFYYLSPLKRRFCYIQIVIITKFVVVSSVGIKRFDPVFVGVAIVVVATVTIVKYVRLAPFLKHQDF